MRRSVCEDPAISEFIDDGDDVRFFVTDLKPYCVSLPYSAKLKAQMKAEREKVHASVERPD